ncbi:MAG: apolipoprotein N-acyltransferase, partial [Acidobacteriota bacterium]|nr:apolipoprotein N-acyltransferase [Acidobacteriota bacterium]
WRLAFGYAAGVVYWFGLCNWIQWTLAQYAGVNGFAAWLLFILLCLAKAVQMGVFAALCGVKPAALPGFRPAYIAALWVVLEWTHPYTGFEWLSLGNAGSNMVMLLRAAPFTGVWGISFAFALISAVIAAIILRRQRYVSVWLLLLLVLFALPDVPEPEHGADTAVIVQPNMSDDTSWTPELVESTLQHLRGLSLAIGGPDVIVWPEAPAPFYADDPTFTAFASKLAKDGNAAFLAGTVAHASDRSPLNSAMLVNPRGGLETRYDKVHLVPFGEFVPWPFGVITSKVSTEAGDFEPGRTVVVNPIDSHREGAFICYESVFPSFIRQFVNNGANVLFNISNDSWFGKSQARYQHLQIVRMRAAENRRWIVRATNNGVSAVIDPAGRVTAVMPEFQQSVARLRYSYRSDLTFYTKHGDWFVLVCAVLVLLYGCASLLPSRYSPQ